MTASLTSRLTAKSLWPIPKPIARFTNWFSGTSEPRVFKKNTMVRMRRRGRNARRTNTQTLTHTAVFTMGGPTSVSASNLGLIGIATVSPARPCRPVHVKLTVVSGAPHIIRFAAYAGGKEEIFASAPFAVGLAPRVLKFRLPKSTDFSLYSAPGSTVFTSQPMSDINVSVKIGVLATFEYKYPTGALPDYDPAVILAT